jgi:hypothetical protein
VERKDDGGVRLRTLNMLAYVVSVVQSAYSVALCSRDIQELGSVGCVAMLLQPWTTKFEQRTHRDDGSIEVRG